MLNQPVRLAVAAAAGAALCAAFAPTDLWWLALLSPALLMALWQDASPRHAAALGFWFNVGTFAVGTYWLYISIHSIGAAPVWVALLAMAGLVAILGLYGAALGWAGARWLPASGALRWLAGLPALWLLEEWFRGWFLTGFPWLSLGYSQTGTVLAGIAPVTGGVRRVGVAAAGRRRAHHPGGSGPRASGCSAQSALALVWLLPWSLRAVPWTQPTGPAVSVAIIQGAIPQDEKWQASHRDGELAIYRDLTRQALGAQVIVLARGGGTGHRAACSPTTCWIATTRRTPRAPRS